MPTVLLDKSAFEALRAEEHELLGRFTHQIIPPLLVMEILGDAAKEATPGANPWIQVLARKFIGSGIPVAGDWELMIQGSLLGIRDEIYKQIPVTNYEFRRAEDGTMGMIVKKHPLNSSILRWANGQITQIELLAATRWRETRFLLNLDAFCTWVTDDQVALPRARNANHAVELADRFLKEARMAEFWIARASHLAGYDQNQTRTFLDRNFLPSESFAEAAPYAYKCMLGLLSTLIAWNSGQLRSDLNNAKDAMYFTYLPFAACFVSDDRLHQRLAPSIMDESQVLLTSTELRAELALIRQVVEENSILLGFNLPKEVRDLADRSKLIKILCKYLRPATNDFNDEYPVSDESSLVEMIRNRIQGSNNIEVPVENEEVQWMILEQSLPRSVVEKRFGKRV